MPLPQAVTIVEVGPRDGLQNEPEMIATADKLAFIKRLVAAGLRDIEVGSFVHPRVVPQLADAAELIAQLPQAPGVTFSALVPNLTGLLRAIDSGIRRIAVFTAASQTFARKNINMTIEKSLSTFATLVDAASSHGMTVRGYVSTCFVCPYEGPVDASRVLEVTRELLAMGIDQVAISDTVGAAVPTDVNATVGRVLEAVDADRLALHFHDTCGTALANVYAGLLLGIRTFDAAAGGVGGCPFAPGAAGNLATEDLVYLLQQMGIRTGVQLDGLVRAAQGLSAVLRRPLHSRQLGRRRP